VTKKLNNLQQKTVWLERPSEEMFQKNRKLTSRVSFLRLVVSKPAFSEIIHFTLSSGLSFLFETPAGFYFLGGSG
jgi:hypothetical protein